MNNSLNAFARTARLPIALLIALAAVLLLVLAMVPTAEAAKKKPTTPKVRVVQKTFTITIPKTSGAGSIEYLKDFQRTSTQCKYNERALAPGIISSTHYLAVQSFGPAAVSAFVAGVPGKATARLQALCVKGGTPITHKRRLTKFIPGVGASLGGERSGRATATLSCPAGRIAIGTPLALGYTPGFGRISSVPNGPRGWTLTIEDVPQQLVAARIDPAYVDIACVRATSVKKTKLELTYSNVEDGTGTITCDGGRRPLGWGVELDEFTTSNPQNTEWWTTPIVRRAQYAGNSIRFQVGKPANGPDVSVANPKVVFHGICGKLPRG